MTQMTKTLEEALLPQGITPAMLRDWAEAMDKRDGRATVLSDTLRHLAESIPRAGLYKAVEDGRHRSLLLAHEELQAEVRLLTTTRRRLVEEVMAQKERADQAEHDRDTWRRAAMNLQKELDEKHGQAPAGPSVVSACWEGEALVMRIYGIAGRKGV